MGGQVIPWYEAPVIGMYNYTWQEKPVAPPVEEIKQYIANETYQQEKMKEGSGGIGGFLNSYVNPILNNMADDPLKTAAIIAATATGNAYLIPYIVGADTAIAGGSPADILKSAGTAYLTQAVGGEINSAIGGNGFSGVTETGLPTVASEGVASDLLGTTLLGDAGATGAYESAIDSYPTPTPDISSIATDDATKLAQMLKEFGNPTELTGPTIDVASNPTVELGNATVDESYGLPNVPKDLQNEAYLDPGLIDVAPENVTIGTPDATPYFDASSTFPTINVSPEYDPSAYLPTNLGGFDNIPSNLGTNVGGGTQDLGGLDVPFNTPTDLSAGELTVTGERPYVPFEENFPLPYEPFEEDFPLQTETTTETTETTPLTKPKILSNILKSTSALPKTSIAQQQSNLANILRGSQMQQTALPAIYKQANPFNFGQQTSPVQDTTALAKLLRTA